MTAGKPAAGTRAWGREATAVEAASADRVVPPVDAATDRSHPGPPSRSMDLDAESATPAAEVVMRPRLLDLFCCAGGASAGYSLAGFDVVGVDIEPHPNYPFKMLVADALDILSDFPRGRFDAIHASPPCQRYSTMTKRHGTQDDHPDLIGLTRKALNATGLPWIMENVAGAPLLDPVMLCGSMFGLGAVFENEWRYLQRHRLFESNIRLFAPGRCNHGQSAIGVYGNPGGSSTRDGIRFPGVTEWRIAMGADWMTSRELAEAIPPTYTRHLGVQLMAAVAAPKEVAA